MVTVIRMLQLATTHLVDYFSLTVGTTNTITSGPEEGFFEWSGHTLIRLYLEDGVREYAKTRGVYY